MLNRILNLRLRRPWLAPKTPSISPTIKAARTGMVAFNDVMSFLANVATLGALLFAVGGTASSAQGSFFVIDISQMPFSIRFLLVIVLCAATGWALGGVGAWLTDSPNEIRQVFAMVVAIVLACILIFTADWIAVKHRNIKLPELEILTVVGWAMAVWIATFQFRRNSLYASKFAQKSRGQLMLVFSTVCPILFILSAIG